MTRTRRTPITAAELRARLQADPVFVERECRREQETAAWARAARVEEAPLIAELAKVGVVVGKMADLINYPIEYDQAVPILLEHFVRPYSGALRETIARALATPAAAFAWDFLAKEYRAAPHMDVRASVKDGLAVALSATIRESKLEDLVRLIMDPRNGRSRLLLLNGLRKLKTHPIACGALSRLAEDPAFAKEIASWRSRSRRRAIP